MQNTETLKIGGSHIHVKDLDRMSDFYVNLAGIDFERGESSLKIGKGEDHILTLTQQNGFSFPSITEAGLYHNAIVFSNRSALANAVHSILSKTPESYQGSADHLVSEAFYFTDPEGNGLELYYDKPKKEWHYDQKGKPIMGTLPLGLKEFLQANLGEKPQDIEAHMGHIHLKVGDIDLAKEFYTGLLDFDVIFEMDTALFVSRDGYHHHLGMNTWQSQGTKMRQENTYGLYSFQLLFNDAAMFNDILSRIETSKYKLVDKSKSRFSVKDPWGNLILIDLRK